MPVPGFFWTAGHRPLGRAEALEAQVLWYTHMFSIYISHMVLGFSAATVTSHLQRIHYSCDGQEKGHHRSIFFWIACSSTYSPKCFQLGRRQKAYVFSTPEVVDATTHRFPERTSQMASSLVKLGMVSFCNREFMELKTFSHCFLLASVVLEFKWNPCNGLNNTWTITDL